ncbi:hypothetical protein [Microbacterium sp. Se63.02b]|uniref:hypothetical protein n=1 Tax=Microbacterium sp. Se63.02b TaxID=2709304 RepID=UPI001FCE922A|nr:hypothetical protein [Microbacterium sp. Se63.02b]
MIPLLRERRHALAESHVLHRDGFSTAVAKGVPPQVLVEIERQEAMLDAELRWLDSLLSRLESDAIPWGPSAFSNSERYRAQRKAARQ